MADADLWRDLAARFRALPNDHGLFCVDWKQLASGVRIWIPRGTRSTMSQFDAVAARAGVAIDPTGADPRETWLEALIGTLPTVNLTSATTRDEPPSEGKIKDPCGESADLCSALESRAVQSPAGTSRKTNTPDAAGSSILDSEFWRDLAEKFRPIDPLQLLRADWHQVVKLGELAPEVAEWRLVGTDRNTRSVQFEFEALARRGGPKIHPKMESLTGWLEALREHQMNAERQSAIIESSPRGTAVAHYYTGSIIQICQASVNLCKLLESMALETERMTALHEQQKNDPKNWPPLLQEIEAFEAIKGLHAAPPKEISEAAVRKLIAQRSGIKPEDVPSKQIQLEVAGLLFKWPSIKLTDSKPSEDVDQSEIEQAISKAERSALRGKYFASFPEKIKILDVCWAADEHYREWKRWLQRSSPIKDGTKPDLAFRAILTSGKRPLEYRPLKRPPKWQ